MAEINVYDQILADTASYERLKAGVVTKSYVADDLALSSGSREFVAVISTDSVDREGEVVVPTGLERKSYEGAPLYFNHDWAKGTPIGSLVWVKNHNRRVIAKGRISDKTQLARDVFSLMQDGVLKAFSVGFFRKSAGAPTREELAANPHWKGAKAVTRKWELFETSVVGVPMNPDAQALAIAKGVSPETIAALTVPPQRQLEELAARVSKYVSDLNERALAEIVIARMTSGAK